MKKFILLIIFSSMLFPACTREEKTNDGIQENDIILLSEGQVTNFITFLPKILVFSDQYYSKLSQEDKESPDANEKFFKALTKNDEMKMIVTHYGFSNINEMVLVYKNVVLEYTTVTKDFTNYNKDMENLKYTIESYRSNYISGLKDKSLSEDDKKVLEFRLKGLEDDDKRYSNITLIKKYEKMIDDAYQSYYGKQ